MPPIAEVAQTVPERHYTHHQGRGATPHRSNPAVIHRELTALRVSLGMRVLEVGTGSGYSGALLAELVGPTGQVTSLDIDPYLTRWTNLIHHERGIDNIRCHTVDGTAGFPGSAPYDRIVAWCTPPLLPAAWIDQLTDGGILVAPLPIAAVPGMTVVATIGVAGGQPQVLDVAHGGYIEATASPKSDLDLPGRWVDWEHRVPATSWISIAWREQDDWRHTGARTALDLLMNAKHREAYEGAPVDWHSWRTWAACAGDPQLTTASLADGLPALGHTTATTAAVLQQDGTILADTADSPSLAALQAWLAAWEEADRPAPADYKASLVPGQSAPGWDLRVTR